MITDGDTNEMAKEFTTWYVATLPYGASTDGRRFASFDMASNGMSLQCESSWTDAHGTNGPRRCCGPSLRVELASALRATFPHGVPARLLVLGEGGSGKTVLSKQARRSGGSQRGSRAGAGQVVMETCRQGLASQSLGHRVEQIHAQR